MTTEELTCSEHDRPLYYVYYHSQDGEFQSQLYVEDRPVMYCLSMHYYIYYWESETFIPLVVEV